MGEEPYITKFGCRNCKSDSDIEIPWGVKAQDYLNTNNKCPQCGCDTLFIYV